MWQVQKERVGRYGNEQALAPEAQPYQDFIDRVLFAMAGLTEGEAQGVEERLEGML